MEEKLNLLRELLTDAEISIEERTCGIETVIFRFAGEPTILLPASSVDLASAEGIVKKITERRNQHGNQ